MDIKKFLIFIFSILALSVLPALSDEKTSTWGPPYVQNVEAKIKKNWHPPKLGKSCRTKTSFQIARNGERGVLRIFPSSCTPEIDASIIEALDNASPFEPLPKEYKDYYVDIDFTFDYKADQTSSKIDDKILPIVIGIIIFQLITTPLITIWLKKRKELLPPSEQTPEYKDMPKEYRVALAKAKLKRFLKFSPIFIVTLFIFVTCGALLDRAYGDRAMPAVIVLVILFLVAMGYLESKISSDKDLDIH